MSYDGGGGCWRYQNVGTPTIQPGQAVALSGTGVAQAIATGLGTNAIGLAQTAAASGFALVVQRINFITLADWTAATGSSALTVGAAYYLDPSTPGGLTATAPTTPGQIVQQVGIALTPTTLDLSIQSGIML